MISCVNIGPAMQQSSSDSLFTYQTIQLSNENSEPGKSTTFPRQHEISEKFRLQLTAKTVIFGCAMLFLGIIAVIGFSKYLGASVPVEQHSSTNLRDSGAHKANGLEICFRLKAKNCGIYSYYRRQCGD